MNKLRLAILTGIATCFVATAPVLAGSFTDAAASQDQSAGKQAASAKSRADVTKRGKKPQNQSLFTIKIPEPSNVMMLGLGIAGLIAGRWAAKRRRGNSTD